MKNVKRGFTLIELLVVIAIIGILSAIVLASLSSARAKANDAKIQGQLSSIRAAAEVYSSSANGNYGNDSNSGDNVCNVNSTDTTGLYNLEQSTSYPGGVAPTCTTDAGPTSPATQWSAYLVLSNSTFFCVDSTGQSKGEPSSWTAPTGGGVCP